MLEPEFHLGDDFPPASYEQWRALAEADLAGASFEQKLVTHTYEGIDLQPLYTRRDRPTEDDPEGFPGQNREANLYFRALTRQRRKRFEKGGAKET